MTYASSTDPLGTPTWRPMAKAKLPPIISSFRVHAGTVDEITWTSEDQVIKYLRCDRTEEETLETRLWLREMGRQGILTARTNPEHGFWEYGPQWRVKDFGTRLKATEAAAILAGTDPRIVDRDGQ